VKLKPKTLRPVSSRLANLLAGAACIWFISAGLAFLPRIGIEDDEALFSIVFFQPHGGVYYFRLGHTQLPLMILPYLGTLKSWLYQPLSLLSGTGVQALRIPALLAGAASLWLFYRLLFRVAGERAALIGCGLLAVDAMYLLTSCFDWGPVALQHLAIIGGVLAIEPSVVASTSPPRRNSRLKSRVAGSIAASISFRNSSFLR